MTQNRSCDALIVGAGPVGLTMASALHRQGLTCRIVDKAPQASDKSKALVVWCRTMELLSQLDLADTFVAAGRKIQGGSIYGDGKRLAHLTLTGGDSAYGFPLMIPQNVSERVLTEHLATVNIRVERPVELVAFREGGDAIEADLRHADGRIETLESKWLIGCDGAHSTVRHTLGMEFSGHAEPNDWMLADVHIAGPLATDEVTIYWHAEGILAFFPITTDRFRVIADLGAADDKAPRSEPALVDVQARLDARGPGNLTASDPVWLANFRINERKVADYRRGRVMLAGDAAHIHSPAGGQGMNTGMQDAFNLAWKLGLAHRGGDEELLLTSYSVERSAVGDQVLRDAERFTTLTTLRSPVAQSIRNHLAPILTSFQFFQDKIRNTWMELSISYPDSPLSRQDWPLLGGGVGAGERMPDVRLKNVENGRESALLAQFDPRHHTLVLVPGSYEAAAIARVGELATQVHQAFPGEFKAHLILASDWTPGMPGAPTAIQHLTTWQDVGGTLHERLAPRDATVYCVRPDGYVGYRGQPAEAAKLLAYLQSYLRRV